MAMIMRFECDAPGCGAHYAIDVLHRAGPSVLYQLTARWWPDGGTEVAVNAEFRPDGWYIGTAPAYGGRPASGSDVDMRALCEAHGAPCPTCNGDGSTDLSGRALPSGPKAATKVCATCEGYGVIRREG